MIWGALTMVIGASTLALGIAAVALIRSSNQEGQFAASLTAGTFMTLAMLALAWGLIHLAVGALLRRRRYISRLAALLLGSVDLLLPPYGTALGAYSLWTLLREDGKAAFEDIL